MVPGPLHDMVNEVVVAAHEYAVTGSTEQVLSMVRSHAAVQVIWPGSLTCAALIADPVAGLFIRGALVAPAVGVLSLTWRCPGLGTAVPPAVKVGLGARSQTLQLKVWAPTAPPPLQLAVAVVQLTLPPAGNGSLIVAALAVP